MKILLVDSHKLKGGHHLPYLKTILKITEHNYTVISPDEVDLECETIELKYDRGLKNHYLWIRELREIIMKEKPDIVHFLYGDVFYRYFGQALKILKGTKIVVTFHHVQKGAIRAVSYRNIFRNIDVGVVHTESICEYLKGFKIKNVAHIEYPRFEIQGLNSNVAEARNYYNLDNGKMIFLALGKTRFDKGLDLLLEALGKVKGEFCLFVAGGEADFTKEYILKNAKSYMGKIKLQLRYLEDTELAMAVKASDVVILPYRKTFDGASGPLVEGIWENKMIIGPNHGSLGRIIEDNHLGYTFESENVDDLTRIIEQAIKTKWVADDTYHSYRNEITEEFFLKKYRQLYTEC